MDKGGYTLLEMVIALAIVSVLSAAATAALAGRIALARAEADENRLYRTLAFARQSAILYGIPVLFCSLAEDGSCVTKGGREAAVLAAGPKDGQEILLLRAKLADTKAWLEYRGAFGREQLRFAPDGTAAEAGSWIYCPGNGRASLRRRVVVNQTGRIYPAGDRDDNGQRDGTEGKGTCRPILQ